MPFTPSISPFPHFDLLFGCLCIIIPLFFSVSTFSLVVLCKFTFTSCSPSRSYLMAISTLAMTTFFASAPLLNGIHTFVSTFFLWFSFLLVVCKFTFDHLLCRYLHLIPTVFSIYVKGEVTGVQIGGGVGAALHFFGVGGAGCAIFECQ